MSIEQSVVVGLTKPRGSSSPSVSLVRAKRRSQPPGRMLSAVNPFLISPDVVRFVWVLSISPSPPYTAYSSPFYRQPSQWCLTQESEESGALAQPRTRCSSQYGRFQHNQQPGAISGPSNTGLYFPFHFPCSWSSNDFARHKYPSRCECALCLVIGSTANQEEKPHDNELSRMSTPKIEV